MPMTGSSSLGLYVHIPFCKKRCPYCHFFVITNQAPFEERFILAVKNEWILKKVESPIHSIYFGGGTPTRLKIEHLVDLLAFFKGSGQVLPEAEITIEANPEDLNPQILAKLKDAGFNRISIGIQSFSDEDLSNIGRGHLKENGVSAILMAAEAGFSNLSIDLMYDLPGQTLPSFQKTLSTLIDLPITHLSLYNLVIEPHTVFYKHQKEIKQRMPQDEESLAMIEHAVSTIEKAGLKRYEISAFAKPGFEAKHNQGYWEGKDFIGLGPSAFSYLHGSRFQNTLNMNKYLNSILDEGLIPIDFEETLDTGSRAKELFAIGLRLVKGARIAQHPLPKETLDAIYALASQDYLKIDGDIVKLTEKGRLFYDDVGTALI